jgi:hypothetical protein
MAMRRGEIGSWWEVKVDYAAEFVALPIRKFAISGFTPRIRITTNTSSFFFSTVQRRFPL